MVISSCYDPQEFLAHPDVFPMMKKIVGMAWAAYNSSDDGLIMSSKATLTLANGLEFTFDAYSALKSDL